MKNLLSILLAFFLSACDARLSLPKEPTMSKESFKDLNITHDWYKAYDSAKLNEFLNFVLLNNSDINIARGTLLTALARVDLIDYDFYPTLSANLGFSGEKNLNPGVQSKKFSSSLNLSYELDIYGRIRDSSSVSDFSAKASAYDLENSKISMISTALNGTFKLACFNDVDNPLKEYLASLEQVREFYAYKFELGKIKELDLLNVEQNLLKARQNLLRNEQNRNLLIKNLQDSIGKQEGFARVDYFKTLTLSSFKNLDPNFSIPLEALVYRPDVRSRFNTLKFASKDYTSVQKSISPSISLGGALNSSDKQFDDSFKFEVLSGNIKISSPFLDYGRVKQNIKISQFDYESMLVNYGQSLQSAMNESVLNYKGCQSNTVLLQILKNTSFKQELITQAYWEKYNLGKNELKDYLDASNTLNSAKQSLLGARFNLLKTINSYYQTTVLNYDERNLEMP